MNRVTAIGRLTVDPELRSASSGKKVCSMRLVLARRERAGEDQGAVLVDVVAFEGLAVACASALGKGSKIVIDGRLEHRTWQDKDGSKRSRHEVIAHEVVFLDAPPPSRTERVGSSLRRLARTPPAEPPPTMITSARPARPLPISDIDLVLLESVDRGTIVASERVSRHRRIPVIQ